MRAHQSHYLFPDWCAEGDHSKVQHIGHRIPIQYGVLQVLCPQVAIIWEPYLNHTSILAFLYWFWRLTGIQGRPTCELQVQELTIISVCIVMVRTASKQVGWLRGGDSRTHT